jgi:hypothetical protein
MTRKDSATTQYLRNHCESWFQTLRLWQNDSVGDGRGGARAGGIVLVIRAYSKSDTGNMEDAIEKQERVDSEGDDDIGATRFELSFLHLDGELPEVAIVSELEVYGRNYWISDDLSCDPRPISGDAVTRLMGCLPQLRRAHVQLSDEESRDMALRERERDGKMLRASSLFCYPR